MKNNKDGNDLSAVEMFAGIGGFRLAAEEHGIETVWANDVDENACIAYRDRFGDEELVEGDIRQLHDEIPSHDVLTAGFPCQSFSAAGKKQGLRDPRGHLFEEVIRVLDAHEPSYFILENVRRLLTMEKGSHFATILHELTQRPYRVEWRLLNATDFGLPQNRQRIVITGIHERIGTWKDGVTSRLASSEDLAEVPEDLRLVAHDFNEWTPIVEHGRKFPRWGLSREGRFIGHTLESFSESDACGLLRDLLQDEVDGSFDFTESTKERLSDNTPVNRFVNGVEVLSNQRGGARMGYTVFGVGGIAPTLTSSTSRHYERYKIGNQYRRLTNVEYARLQGFPDDHCEVISAYQQYFLYGNAVPPPMVSWVFKQLLEDDGVRLPKSRQMVLVS